jgi:hypothetical protein
MLHYLVHKVRAIFLEARTDSEFACWIGYHSQVGKPDPPPPPPKPMADSVATVRTVLCCSGTECLSAVLIIHNIDAAVLSNHQCVVVASRTTRLI